MKKFIFITMIAAVFAACNQGTGKASDDKDSSGVKKENTPVSKDSLYGKAFDYKDPAKLTELMEDPSKLDTTKDYAVAAVVTTVCQKRGCWFRAEDGKGGDIFVKILTEDENAEEVGIPMTSPAGTNVIFYGTPKYREVSVKTQRHYAEDAGASKEAIEAINKPKMEWRFFATGVVVKG
jgi:hypothetical protein